MKALKDLYESRGYLEAQVIPLIEPSKDGKKLGITYLCEEGRLSRTRSLRIQGNTAVPTGELESKIQLAAGRPYSPSLAERDRLTILSLYNDLGYLQAEVAVRAGPSDDANSYPVEFQIREGTQSVVDRILVLGNDRTQASVIEKRIKIKENEPLSLGRLLQTQQALYGLGVFDQVRVAPQNPDSTAPHQDIVVRLQESKRFTLRYGLGYQEREKLRGTVELSHLNIFGSARRADIRVRGSNIEQQVLFGLQQPQFRALPVDTYLTFSAAKKRDVSFDSTRFNAAYQFSHPFGGHSWGMFRYNFERVSLYNVQVTPEEREDTPRNLSTFSIAYISDTRDDYLDPTKGFFTSNDFGVTTKLLGSNNYVSFLSQSSYFRRLPKSLLMAAGLRIGLAHPYGGDVDLPISERFFAGGASSLRGFETDFAGPLDTSTWKPLGGNGLVAASMEIRVPLFSSVHLACFYDTGNVFGTISDIAFSGFSHSLGVGLRIKTPFGPFRVDYGYHLNIPSELKSSALNNYQGLTPAHLFITVGPPF
jgi:outer membrane protein insertion porin family